MWSYATQKSSFKVHVKSQHEDVKFACEKCEMQYETKISLASHVQQIHEGQYQCWLESVLFAMVDSLLSLIPSIIQSLPSCKQYVTTTLV